ncbi:hypothetical protein Pfo_013295 [Paulownia fortunei]|nr:hypothetical protein Pfo_013295 [Paulownia fortunei]
MIGLEFPVHLPAQKFHSASSFLLSSSHGYKFKHKLYHFTLVPIHSFVIPIRRGNPEAISFSVSVSNSSFALPEQPPASQPNQEDAQRKVPNVQTLRRRFWKVAALYWFSDDKVEARWRLAAVFALTLETSGISDGFNFLGLDFYNALANKDQEQFTKQLLYYLAGFVFILRDYAKDTLSLRWRSWMTSYYMDRYLKNQTFYEIQSQSITDNPDQRIVDDLSSFTGTALAYPPTIFNATVDLISFSIILYGIYPPLFLVLLAYSLVGTAIKLFIFRIGVSKFLERKERSRFPYGLFRIRENAESIAFYGGEENEMQLLLLRFSCAFENLSKLLISSRNLEFFTNAAVVAPMYFSGKIEFGVINESAISAFSDVIDRLVKLEVTMNPWKKFVVFCNMNNPSASNGSVPLGRGLKLLTIEHLTLLTPSKAILIRDLSLEICEKDHLLVTGPSGSGKTSLLRAIAGLWSFGRGTITFYDRNARDSLPCLSADVASPEVTLVHKTRHDGNKHEKRNARGVFFLPQKPCSLPFHMLTEDMDAMPMKPATDDLIQVLEDVRLAFARMLLSKPNLVLLDESTSALDEANEAHLFKLIEASGITCISIGHRRTLYEHHKSILHISHWNQQVAILIGVLSP